MDLESNCSADFSHSLSRRLTSVSKVAAFSPFPGNWCYRQMLSAGLRKPDPARVHYERHRPENAALDRLVRDQAETFFAQVEAETAHGLPDNVKTEFIACLDCGILANGFLRLQCGDCHHERIVAFS